MDLRSAFEKGLSTEQYTRLLSDKKELHQLHYRKADIDGTAVDRLRAAGPHRVIVITEPWCGDSLAVLPVVTKLLEAAGNGAVRILLRDEHPDVMDRYLTNGARAIPKFVFMDEDFTERFHWGPRPDAAQRIFEDHRADITAGRIGKPEVHKKIRGFYARNRGRAVVEEIIASLGEASRSAD